MNMLVLWLVGRELERVLGHWRYLSLYVAALLAGSFAVMLYDPGILTVGASGAIFGLFGAVVAYQRDRGISIMQSGLGGLILINLLITFAIPGISIAGHIGGLIGGALVGFAMFEIDKRVRTQWAGVAVAAAFSVAFLLGGIWAANAYVANRASPSSTSDRRAQPRPGGRGCVRLRLPDEAEHLAADHRAEGAAHPPGEAQALLPGEPGAPARQRLAG